MQNKKIIFWGTGPLAESTLYALYKSGIVPDYIVTKPDSLVGRKQILTPPYIKLWAEQKGITVLQPEKLKDFDCPVHDISIVASYGKIIPQNILNIPSYGFINVHPSDLPRYRGPSPIESALLAGEREITVSIMLLDAGMDTGPVLVKQRMDLSPLDTAESVERASGALGGELIESILTHYLSGALKAIPQDNAKATICKYIEKSQGEIQLTDSLEEIKNKWRAFYPWPGLYFYINHSVHGVVKSVRVKINAFDLLAENIESAILKVTPEGRSEMTYNDFKNGYLISNPN